jgi:hypothetical protein
MHARASEAKIWSAQILMLFQAARESEEGSRQTYAFARHAMENEENQPTNKCNQTARNGDEHEPTHHTE